MGKCESNQLDNYAGFILTACVIAILFGMCVFCVKSCKQASVYENVHLLFVTDSAGTLSSESRSTVDSLISISNHNNAEMHDRYEYILQQKEDQETYFTVGGIFLTAIASVFVFFGYRSFHSIEERAEVVAKDKANERTESAIADIKEDLIGLVTKAVKEKVDELNYQLVQRMSELKNELITPQINEMNDREKELNEIKKRLDKIEIILSQLGSILQDDQAIDKENLQRKSEVQKPFETGVKGGEA